MKVTTMNDDDDDDSKLMPPPPSPSTKKAMKRKRKSIEKYKNLTNTEQKNAWKHIYRQAVQSKKQNSRRKDS